MSGDGNDLGWELRDGLPEPKPHITSPAHYDKPGCSQWALGDLIRKADLGFDEGSAMKYLYRHGEKGGAADIRKAVEHCRHILRTDYGEEL